MEELFCTDCTTKTNVYPIIVGDLVEPLCSTCIVSRETAVILKESGRTELDIKQPRIFSLTVGELKESLKEVPDSTLVAYQRIEDVYFDKYNWTSHELSWGLDSETSEYIIAFSSYWHSKKNVFVINAHY